MAAKTDYLFPTVLWAQRKDFLLLRVMLQSVEKPDFKVTETYMEFKGIGFGQSGKNTYSFSLTFLEPISVENLRYTYSEKEIQFRIPKLSPGTWPRLQVENIKPHWLMVDFDHFVDQDSEEEDGKGDASQSDGLLEEQRQKLHEVEQVIEKVKQDVKKARSCLDRLRRFYLFIYNTLQFLVFMAMFIMLLYHLRRGKAGMRLSYEAIQYPMKVMHLLMFLEILHAVTGIVKSNLFSSIIQICGRNMMLFMIVSPVEQLHQHLVVFTLFFAWTAVETIRYPYYALSALDVELGMVTWLRYTVWMVLYPMGGLSEVGCVWLALPHIKEQGLFSFQLPNEFNFSFDLATFLQVYLFMVPCGVIWNMIYLSNQRKKKLSKLKED